MTSIDRRSVLKTIGTGAVALATGVGTASAQDDETRVRVAHASPDAPAVDVYVDAAPEGNDPTIAELEFTDVTEYLTIPSGEHKVTITAAGDTDPVSPTPLSVELGDNPYTFAAIGELSPESGESCFTVDVYQDDLSPLDEDTGRVRAYHAVPDAPPVDVRVVDGPTLASELNFAKEGPNTEVQAGTYPVEVVPTGGEDPVFGPVDVEVRAGQVLTVFAVGNLEPEGDEPEFQPVLAYEEAAPFGGGNGDGMGGGDGEHGGGMGSDGEETESGEDH